MNWQMKFGKGNKKTSLKNKTNPNEAGRAEVVLSGEGLK